MGGDGGTLNNSRREHVRARAKILGLTSSPASTQRASVTECALTKQPLAPPHVVVDRLGQLYNKEALISYILTRRSRNSVETDAFAHIKSVKKDTANVRLTDGELLCMVTRKVATEEGGFSVGWKCGCVCARIRGVQGVGEGVCASCGIEGERVLLGLAMKEREKIFEEERKKRKRGKKRGLEERGEGDGDELGAVKKVLKAVPKAS